MNNKNSLPSLNFKLKRKWRRLIKKLPIYFYHIKFILADRIKARGSSGKISFLGYKISYTDLHSLSVEYREIFKNQIYHFETTKQSPVILDGGGCVGMSVFYFKHIYPESQITVFEPNQDMINLLKTNLSRNNMDYVKIVNKALYSEEGSIGFSGESDAGKISENGEIKIPTIRLSNYIDSNIDFLKLNVEGSESEVLVDLDEKNKLQYIPQLCIEWHSFSNQEQDLDKILSILKRNNYKYFINHFNYEINPILKPPMRIRGQSQFYLLIHAKKYNFLD